MGSYPADFLGVYENPSAPPLNASPTPGTNNINQRIAACVWISNIGVADFVAPLDSSAKVPIANLYADVANGLATLDSTIHIPIAQIPLSAIIAAIPAMLPTSLPGTTGVMWNNNGVVSIS